ncbi:MAG: nucleotidyl transferase AbiEii/AbiGii toxin family protein [Acidobacteriota bacterium]
MPRFANRSSADRAALIEEASARLDVMPVIVEKDYWVCWTLGRIFGLPDLAKTLVFKGGTSLSKVFHAIRRFSEDIDLSVSPVSLGFSESDIEDAPSRSRRAKLFEKMQKECEAFVAGPCREALEQAIVGELGDHATGKPWLEFALDARTNSPVLSFEYPSTIQAASGYIEQRVKLELGSLTDQKPTGSHSIIPMISEALSSLEPESATVLALEVERTFWEKATILHAEYHRPTAHPVPDRFARHYSDFASLWNHTSREAALSRIDLLERVALLKSRFFGSSWSNYDSARTGSLRLTPPENRVSEMERDYEKMKPMFLEEPPIFADVLQVLRVAEERINR